MHVINLTRSSFSPLRLLFSHFFPKTYLSPGSRSFSGYRNDLLWFLYLSNEVFLINIVYHCLIFILFTLQAIPKCHDFDEVRCCSKDSMFTAIMIIMNGLKGQLQPQQVAAEPAADPTLTLPAKSVQVNGMEGESIFRSGAPL